MSDQITVHARQNMLVIARNLTGSLAMSYAEANKLQEDIRRALINKGVTLRSES